MNNLTRRTFTTSLAAIPASMAAGAPSAAASAPSTNQHLIDAHKAAVAAAKAATIAEEHMYSEFQRTLPPVEVRMPFGIGHVDLLLNEGAPGERELASGESALAWLERRGFDREALAVLRGQLAAERQTFQETLAAADDRLHEHRRASGYVQAVTALEEATASEEAALQALIEAEPVDLASANAKADYLAAIIVA